MPGSGITAPGSGIPTPGIGIRSVGSAVGIRDQDKNKNTFRDQNSHQFWDER